MKKRVRIIACIIAAVVLSGTGAVMLLNGGVSSDWLGKMLKIPASKYVPAESEFVEPTEEDWDVLAASMFTWHDILDDNYSYNCEKISGSELFSRLVAYGYFPDYSRYFGGDYDSESYKTDDINWILLNIYNVESGVGNYSHCDYEKFRKGCFTFYPNHPIVNVCPMYCYDIVKDDYRKTDDGRLVVKVARRLYEDNSPAEFEEMTVGLKMIDGKRCWSLYEYSGKQ